MRFNKSLRFKLLISYLVTILIPVIIIILIMPYAYMNSVGKNTKVLTETTLNSIVSNIDVYLNDLERLTLVPYYDDEFINALVFKSSGEYSKANDYNKLAANRVIRDTLKKSFLNTRGDILSTILVTLDGDAFSSSNYYSGNTKLNYNFYEAEWFKKAIEADGDVAYISPHSQDYFVEGSTEQVFSVARLIKEPYTQKPIAVMMADAHTIVLKNILNKIEFDVSSLICISDENSNIIYSNKKIASDTKNQIIEGNKIVKSDNDNYKVVSNPVEKSGWNINVLFSMTEVASQTRWIYIVGILLAIIGVIITYILFEFLSKDVVNPFNDMMVFMKEIEEGNLDKRFKVYGDDEIASLGKALNRMAIKLNEHINREYKAVISQKNAEYKALQSQIQPHFLYNTLSSFIGLNRIGDKASLEKGILDLTGMLRYILDRDDVVPISEELMFIKRYCELQQLRFKDRIDFILNYHNDINNYRIPKLLLQPIIENSIIHCVEKVQRKIEIVVSAAIENKSVIISVKDNGDGFNTNILGRNNSIGIENIKERLKLLYENSTFTINSKLGSGTEVIIEIPLEDFKV